jgi:type II secretory pathway pseudopilin PulG
MKHTPRSRGEAGETLAELVVAIAIIGLAVVVLVGGLAEGILASDVHRRHATADTVARDVAEAVKDRNIIWQSNGVYPSSTWSSLVPSGYSVTVTGLCWSSYTTPATFSSCTSAPGNANLGLQQLTITATAPGSRARDTVVVLKRRT